MDSTDADYPGNIHLPIGQIAQVVPAGEARPRLYDASQPRRVRRSGAGVRLFLRRAVIPFPLPDFTPARFYGSER